ncbi:cytochrome c peroxidase [Hyalangium gracile]|uniref:cytochrome c peroxidase n=1 Tax=Hyalangium gracile TaxID=394092 RepID=UPI001CCE114A|nr:cytochrome c peroxidase [Hyalangium gracile]
MKRFHRTLLTALCLLAAAGCGEPAADEAPLVEDGLSTDVEQDSSVSEGSYLFQKEVFAGNGRTCVTCHTLRTGTLSPADIASRRSSDPIFKMLDSDDGRSTNYTKLKAHATVNVTIPLPPNVRLANSTARSITLRRGIPSTLDTPALDPVLMWDGREPTLQHQALSAALGHAEARRAPTADQQDKIALFEKTLFSSAALQSYSRGGPPPPLPAGTTASEQRGRAFFAPTGLCGSCHGGPLLNTMTEFNPQGLPAGSRFSSAAVSEGNLGGNPVFQFLVKLPDGTEVPVASPDPGLMLVTGDPAHANVFKMVSLRNLKNTAPYFHDNSAKTLDAVMVQYKLLFDFMGIPLSTQDIADITAYMKLL